MARNPKRLHRLAVLLVTAVIAILIFGCGGGGGGGGGGSNGNTTGENIVNITAVALFQGTQSPASPLVGSSSLETYELQPGDVAQVELIGYGQVSQRPYVLTGSNFSTDAPSNVATISSSGLLTAMGSSPNITYHFFATYQGLQYEANLIVINPAAKVKGVVDDDTGQIVAGVVVIFYDSSGAIQAETQTGLDGSFIANVPVGVVAFSVDATGLSRPSYYHEYTYNGFTYSSTVQSCYTPITVTSASQTLTLSTPVTVYPNDANNPPPPPTGCGQ